MAEVEVTSIPTTGCGIDDEIGELTRALSMACQAPAIADENSGLVRALEGGVQGSCNDSASADDERSGRRAWLEQLRSECASEEEFETARSQPTWTEVAPTSSCSAHYGPLSADLERLRIENELHFQHLVERYPLPPDFKPYGLSSWFLVHSEFDKLVGTSPFFTDFGGRVEVGRKIGGGGQADIYEVLFDGKDERRFVLKVFRSDASLADLQRQWITEIGKGFSKWRGWHGVLVGCCFTKNGTLLKDGRFAFVMERYWGDLRKAIDLQIVKDKTYQSPPFPLSTTIKIMHQIAYGMRVLHGNDILHRDLKAANVLLSHDIEKFLREEENFVDCDVADFESCGGVLGTRFWRAPEILLALKNNVTSKFSDPEIWTEKVDVYSYGMTSYEVLTGCIPFQNRPASDYDGVIGGERPPLPDYVDFELQELLRRCWHSEPSMRPTFQEIQDDLDSFICKRMKVYEGLAEDERDAEAKGWIQHFKYLHHWESDDERVADEKK